MFSHAEDIPTCRAASDASAASAHSHHRCVLRSLGLIALLIPPAAAAVQFNTWYDEQGKKHVSNVPRECITESKTLKPECRGLVVSGDPAEAEAIVNSLAAEKAARENAIRKESLERYLEETDPLNQMRKKSKESRERYQKEYERKLLQRDPNAYIEERRRRKEKEERWQKDRAQAESRARAREELEELGSGQ